MKKIKVAIVHDYLKEFGGAERVVDTLVNIWPDAKVYTSVFLPKFAGPNIDKVEKWRVKPSFLQIIPLKAKLLSPFRLIAPLVFSLINLKDYDVVITSAAGTYTSPNFVRVGRNTKLICYCHTPPRYLYGFPVANPWDEIAWRRILRFFGQVPMHFLRLLDFQAAQKPDYFIANSKEVASRIEKFYRRDSKVIYPPVDVEMGTIASKKYEKEDFYLTGGRLARHKGQDMAIKACTKLGVSLKVFGGGFASYGENDLRKLAGSNIEFLGEISDAEKWKLMAQAKAFIFPSEMEDFGIIPVEAMSAGTPVIALGQGGVLETVVDGKTGILFSKRNTPFLIDAIKRFENTKISSQDCIENAKKFSKKRFAKEIEGFVLSLIN